MILSFALFIANIACVFMEEESPTEDNPIASSPHIIFILADDLGWNDVSFHGSPQIPTPNIDALAASSLILNNYYTESLCTPSRAALMTGQYPIHLGLQHSNIKAGEPTGLSLNVTIMPEYLKIKGYATHIVGKWHLGYSRKEYTPMFRGFDSFYGFFNEQIDYYDYTSYEKPEDSDKSPFYGINFQDGTETVNNLRGRYATDVFTERALSIIQSHNESQPLFLYVAHLAPHTGNDYMRLQASFQNIAKFDHIKDIKRRTYAGVVSSLDDSVGQIVGALNQKGLLENTIIVFTSDNGAETDKYGKGMGSNWPLRGQKMNSFEGAIRVPCFVWSPLLGLQEPRTSQQLMHVSDWLPTLYSAAGGDVVDLGAIDGLDIWNNLLNNSPSSRIEILHNIDPLTGSSSLRRGDYKLILGTASGDNDLWYGKVEMESPASMDEWVWRNDTVVKRILESSGYWLPKIPDSWRMNATLRCGQPQPVDCDPTQNPCLFNIAADPCEYNNLASQYPRVLKSMMEILQSYEMTAVNPLSTEVDPQADPRCHQFTFVSWLDEEYTDNCPFA